MRTWLLIGMFAMLAEMPAWASPCSAVAADSDYLLDDGYAALYDLDFERGDTLFVKWEAQHPGNALGPASRASGYLFQEFERLGVLRSELFTEDADFQARKKLSASSEVKARFQQQLELANKLADEQLARNPSSADALLAKALANGLQADYAALIEKRNGPALSFTKEGRRWAERLLAADASCYDAYLALGIENYLVSVKPLLVRWIAQLGGARSDRQQGIRELTLTAQKGRFFKPFAKLLLAVAALRDRDAGTTRQLLMELHQQFPHNSLYEYELARLRQVAPNGTE
jgi:hypothetical protein